MPVDSVPSQFQASVSLGSEADSGATRSPILPSTHIAHHRPLFPGAVAAHEAHLRRADSDMLMRREQHPNLTGSK